MINNSGEHKAEDATDLSSESYVLVSNGSSDCDSDSDNGNDSESGSSSNDDGLSDGELTDVFPSPPPSTPLAGDTPVRMRGPPSPMVPRWSSPNAASINAANDSDGGTSPSPSLVSASYQELANRPRSNPRVRTPMRNISAVPLGTVNRSTIVDNGNDDDDAGARVSNISSAAAGRSATGVRTQLGLGAGLAVGTVLREGDMALLHQQVS